MNPILKAKHFLNHWLRSVDEHSMHSPFIFEFFTQSIKEKGNLSWTNSIESARKKYLNNKDSVQIIEYGAGSKVNQGTSKRICDIARYELSEPSFSRLLSRIVKKYQRKEVLELGTSLGINTLYLALAASAGRVVTMEGNPEIVGQAQKLFSDMDQQNIELQVGNIDKLLPKYLGQNPQPDLIYMDANHTYEATVSYFHQLLPCLSEEAILIIDDIYWSEDMIRAWKYVISNEAVSISVDLFKAGIVFFKSGIKKANYRVLFP